MRVYTVAKIHESFSEEKIRQILSIIVLSKLAQDRRIQQLFSVISQISSSLLVCSLVGEEKGTDNVVVVVFSVWASRGFRSAEFISLESYALFCLRACFRPYFLPCKNSNSTQTLHDIYF